ncbi:GNAT family N-acetyltransferase [Alteromonas sp. AMM-1]|uniref:GNAT family N-acetyltransferase n=1 Tax=Alteromonas sp. AMM-1 TaxID=3394233 RepID=UPI0039A5221C
MRSSTAFELVKPHARFETSYREYIYELGDEERYPFPMDFVHDDFAALLTRLQQFEQGRDLPDGFIASTTYWLVQGHELIGVSNLRHALTAALRHAGGHIGLGIRPSYRGQGLGKFLLGKTLIAARQIGIENVHVHCYEGNGPSSGMIIANGGVLHSELKDGNQTVLRYIIPG